MKTNSIRSDVKRVARTRQKSITAGVLKSQKKPLLLVNSERKGAGPNDNR